MSKHRLELGPMSLFKKRHCFDGVQLVGAASFSSQAIGKTEASR